jgi:hypothetical protein
MALVDVERNLAATGPRLREHISAQGARAAALEMEIERWRPSSLIRDDYEMVGGALGDDAEPAVRAALRSLAARATAQQKAESDAMAIASRAANLERERDAASSEVIELRQVEENLRERLSTSEESVRDLTRRAQHAEGETAYWQKAHAKAARQRDVEWSRAETAEARCATLSAVGQVLSEHVGRVSDHSGINTPCRHNGRWHAPIGGTGFNCSDCGERIPVGMVERLAQQVNTGTYPCSPTCTHSDARTPGHPERVKKRSESFAHGALGLPTPEERRAAVSIATTEEDVDLEFVEEALTEESDSKVSNGALYWRRRFLKLAARLGWMDVETMSRRKDEARDEGAEAMRAACWGAVQPLLQRMGIDHITQYEFKHAIEGATP